MVKDWIVTEISESKFLEVTFGAEFENQISFSKLPHFDHDSGQKMHFYSNGWNQWATA